jgi:hypothetical protein
MSTLRTYNVQNPDSLTTNIELSANGGINVAGVITATSFSGSGTNLTNLNASNLSTGSVPSARITSTNALTVGGDLYVTGNISFGGTTTQLNTQQLQIVDADIILGIGTTFNSTDNTANHGGIAIASTEGSPLVNLNITPSEILPTTYKKIMWFKNNTAGLGTDAWLSNYAVGIGSTQFPTGTRFASGTIKFGEDDINVVRNINSSGIVTATRLTSSVATGTAPFTVSSTTLVTNLNADLLDGKNTGTSGNTIPLLDGTNTWSSGQTFNEVNLTINSNVGIGATTALTSMSGRLLFDNDFSDTSRGPNKIQMYNDGIGWIGGFGVHSDTVSYYAGGTHKWYKSNSQTSFTQVLSLDGSGNLVAIGNVTAYSSDRRLKENFKHIESPLEKVQKLNGYTFDWNKKSEEFGFVPQYKTNDVGLIAQEVQEVLPQAAVLAPFDRETNNAGETVSKSGENYLTIQYERLVPLLVEAIKEQQEQINTLKEEINNLKK